MEMSYDKSRSLLEKSCKALQGSGAEKSSCFLTYSKTHELNVDGGEISLFRTIFDTQLTLTVIHESKKGTVTTNRTDERSLQNAVEEANEMALSSQQDDAYDIAEGHTLKVKGNISEPESELMYERLKEMMALVKERWPEVIVEQTILRHKDNVRHYQNSRSADLYEEKGYYELMMMFTAKKGAKSSSFNGCFLSMNDLSCPLLKYGGLERLISEAPHQIEARPFPGKSVGDIIITPECLDDFIEFLAIHLSDRTLITGTSFLKDSLNRTVAPPFLTLKSAPRDRAMAGGYAITRDGFPAENLTIIDKGVLKSYLLSQYGANKCGLERAVNDGYYYVIEPGSESLATLIGKVDKGLVLNRFSGGNPGENGDFSGVAKNSFLIENGQVKGALNETMISGNVRELFLNIKGLSREVIDTGYSRLPWVHSGGVTISGKN